MMKAALVQGKDSDPTIAELPKPIPTAGFARLRVLSTALNRRDVWIQRGQYAGIRYPAVLGSDVCGIVDAVGDEAGLRWLQREVIVNPNVNWGHDEQAQSGEYQILGMPSQGGLAQYLCVPYHRLHDKPQHLTSEEAAALPLAGLTAYRATVAQAALRRAERVLVTGVGGGVALFVVQFARALEARVIVSSRSDDKLERALKHGAHDGISVRNESWSKSFVQEFQEVDCVIDSVGGPYINDYLTILRPGGRIVSYGATLGPAPSLEIRRIFWKQLRWIGTTMGSDRDFEDMLGFVSAHHIVPIVDQAFDFHEVADAFRHLASNEQFGKVVVRLSQ